MSPSRILIVEDEKIIAKGLEKRLVALGYSVVGSVATGEDALEAADAFHPDLVLMDINLGSGMDGIEASHILHTRSQTPVVFLTAFSDDITIERAKVTEPFGYVLKPFEDSDLRTAIEIGLFKHKSNIRLQEQEQWLSATLNSISEGVIATNERGNIRFINKLAEQLTGWKHDEAVGKSICDVYRLVAESSQEVLRNPVSDLLRNAHITPRNSWVSLLDRDGKQRPVEDSVSLIDDANGKVSGAVLVFRDISDRMRLESNLRQAQKMEAIGRLASGIAHDFNNIMTVINGFSEVLLNDDLSEEMRLKFLRSIAEAGSRGASLTQQIMAFSRKQVLVPCVQDLNAIVVRIEPLITRLIGTHIVLSTSLASDLGLIWADPTQLGQVLMNLAANARDAMPYPKGGKLMISTANVEFDFQSLPHSDMKPGRYAMLMVSDTGVGIPSHILPQMFEPFFTTKDIGQGTGLGLSTVYGIVKQSGGHVDVTSEVGKGTSIKVYLPIYTGPTEPKVGTVSRNGRKGSETILLVDDDESVRQIIKLILERNGYTVLEATSGVDAEALLTQNPHTIQLLVTDLIMPHISGRELANRLTRLKPGLRVLFVSGFTEDKTIHHGVESGATAFLHKPFSVATLTQKVRAVLDAT